MIIALFAIAGVIAGLGLDTLVAMFAREYLENPDDFEGEAEHGAPPHPLDGELSGVGPLEEAVQVLAGACTLPRSLTSLAWLRRALIVGVTAALFALSAWRYDGHGVAPAVVSAYMAALIGCAATDLISFRVPNAFTYSAIPFALAVGLAAPGANIVSTIGGGVGLGLGFFVLAVLTRGGIGMGDVKLATFVGFALGFVLGVLAMFVTAIAGGVVAALLLITRARGRRDPIPYAPYIALGAAWILLSGGTSFLSL